jgi:succinyl-diaminopimelate desuccinylase
MLKTEDLMRELIGLRPVSADLARVNAATVRLREYLGAAGVFTTEQELDGRKILYAATVPDTSVDCLLNAHLDVVPAEAEMFTVREEDGWLYGRGTHDCLGSAALIANLLIQLNGKCRLGAVFSTDEETGGETTRYMVEHGACRASELVCVIDATPDALTVAQKGILTVRLVAEGRACHAAEPWQGDNAIDRLVDGYQRVRTLFAPVLASDQWHNTMAATVFHAGSVHNRVPEVAEIVLNIRYVNPEDKDGILRNLRELSGLSVSVDMQCDPVVCDETLPILQELRTHMERSLKREIPVKRMNGATDARHFQAWGVPVAMLGVPGREPHGSGEAVQLAGLRDYEQMLLSFFGTRGQD